MPGRGSSPLFAFLLVQAYFSRPAPCLPDQNDPFCSFENAKKKKKSRVEFLPGVGVPDVYVLGGLDVDRDVLLVTLVNGQMQPCSFWSVQRVG